MMYKSTRTAYEEKSPIDGGRIAMRLKTLARVIK